MEFPRELYYSQTEACKKFKISVKQFKQMLIDHSITVVSHRVDLGGFEVDTIYVLKEDIDKLNLPLREPTHTTQ